MSLGSRIAERLEALGGQSGGFSHAWLARQVGISQPAITALVNDPARGSKHVIPIAQALKTSPEYLLGQTEDPSPYALPVGTVDLVAQQLGLVMIPEVDIAYGLGGSFIEDYAEERLVPFRRDWLTRVAGPGPADVFLARGLGDSMMPEIHTDDDVLVNRGKRTISQQDLIWALAYGGLGAIKRVRRLPSNVFQLISANRHVPPIEAAEDELHIVGQVIWVGRKVG